jgi:succinate dehydrogenase/fumarate reductase flavoprotein subunit
MKKSSISIGDISVPVLALDVAIIGTGCAGFNAADWLYDLGRRDIAILTEGIKMGTSRNTGSDKQTYYKLTLASDGEDSVAKMAQNLFEGEGVNGDTALAEAANSIRSFIKLANLGVPFPVNEYGEYVGYKTDHDPRQRATSAGPLTSRYMTECLEKSVVQKGITILDGLSVFTILTEDNHVTGLLCLNKGTLGTATCGLTVIRTNHVILATGGPAGCYFTSVYPESQTGMSGMALTAGAKGANLQEWQYGLASTKFRWNVSGTYQQVLPKYISVDSSGIEHEFLLDYYDDPCKALDMEFLKGYQWPFDTTKVNSSSMIDIIVHHEVFNLGRKVYMDFREDPTGLENGFDALNDETRNYLANSHALLKTPIARLEKMNPLAIDLYRQHNIDLYQEPLEVCVCAQHHNGGIAVDSNWQSSVQGLYVAGEAAGTFGVHRPGGSALNSAQVGSLRAAEHIAYTTKPDITVTEKFEAHVAKEAGSLLEQFNRIVNDTGRSSNVQKQRKEIQRKMSLCAAQIREPSKMTELEAEIRTTLQDFFKNSHIANPHELPALLKNYDIFVTQLAVLSAMQKAAQTVGTRGSALVMKTDGEPVSPKLPDYCFEKSRPLHENLLMTTVKTSDGFTSAFEPVRELPHPDGWFENVWNEYRRYTKQVPR